MVSNAVPARVSIATIQPAPAMIAPISGASANWPNDPPALIKPDANARRSGGRRCAVAPIRIEKLPAPAPAADRKPIVSSSAHSDPTNGVAAVPTASITPPRAITRPGPYLSATAPKTGCATPHISCATAITKLMVATPRPVAVFSGDRNRPLVRRVPVVIIMTALATRIRVQAARGDRWAGAFVIWQL
jgi:hypothetical protein